MKCSNCGYENDKNAKYFLLIPNVADKIDYYIESVYDDKEKGETYGDSQFQFVFDTIDVNNNIPVMLTGGAGSGKSSTCEKVAQALRLRFLF